MRVAINKEYKHGIYTIKVPDELPYSDEVISQSEGSDLLLLSDAEGTLLKTQDGYYLAVKDS